MLTARVPQKAAYGYEFGNTLPYGGTIMSECIGVAAGDIQYIVLIAEASIRTLLSV
jgi:hypothetical protein